MDDYWVWVFWMRKHNVGSTVSRKKEQFTVVLNDGIVSEKPREALKTQASTSGWYYFGIVGEIGFAIAIPIAVGALAGQYLDRQFATNQKYTLAGLGLGITISLVTFIRTVIDVLRKKT